MKKNIKIQNILFPKSKELDEHWWMFYRGNRFSRNKLHSSHCLKQGEYAEFFTYFNAFSIEKWNLYTNVEKVYLNLTIQGNCKIQLFGHYMEGEEIKKEFFDSYLYDYVEPQQISISLPMTSKSQVIGFVISAYSDFEIYEGCYSAEIEEGNLRNVDISLVTVTFQKEDFITKNLRLIENEILYSDEDLARHLYVRVIDNGCTLPEREWNSEYIHIYPNRNVGGAGGYTRGMMETLDDDRFPTTHVLLMDDDVMVLPESLIRTYSVLRCLKCEYDHHFISGAMLFYEQLNVQHEDVGCLRKDGSYGPRKPQMEMHLWDSVIRNEKIYKDKPNNYAGWWYCCIPMNVFDRNHLPLPLFIRGDDVEFSIVNKAKFITLNGICIWHMGFIKKFSPAMELYQVHRNSLVIQAASGVTPEADFIDRIKKIFFVELKRFNYVSCDLLLDSIEDYLKGPEFLKNAQGDQIMKMQSARIPMMLDIRDEFSDVEVNIHRIYEHEKPLSSWKQFWYDKTYNGHLLPTFMLNKETAVIAYDWFDAPEKQYLRESVLAVNPNNATGVLRYRARSEFFRLMKRYRQILRRYKRENRHIVEQYKLDRAQMTSDKFWREYLA